MKIPGSAPSTPAVQVPFVSTTFPLASRIEVPSPKYQTLPSRSWAYQSIVRSSSTPATFRLSWMTTQVTPSTTFVSDVTSKVSSSLSPSSVPSYVNVVPGLNGNHG